MQPGLFDGLPTEENGRRLSLEERFARLLERCPDLYPQFVRIALDLRRRGHPRYSADGVGHVLRWHRAVARESNDWKINNNYIALLARKAMAECEELAGFFELRRRRSRR